MAEYTQAGRPMRVDTALDEDVLLLSGFTGVEAVSTPYSFQLDVVSLQDDIAGTELLRKGILISMDVPGEGAKRYIHGLARRFAQLGKRDNLVSYRIEVVPWLWFLNLSRESRIYQELSVPDILEELFQRLGFSDFELRLGRSYAKRTYCVQYRETHFQFVSRLMEEEGIWYYFEHSNEKHLMVMCDDNSGTNHAEGAEFARFAVAEHLEDAIHEMEREDSAHSGRVTIVDYDYLQPTLRLEATLGEDPGEEVYDYPGKYTTPGDGERIARLLLEAEEAERQIVHGAGNVRGLIPGHHFTLEKHYRKDANSKYLVMQVQHDANAGEYRAWDNNAEVDYQMSFRAIPHDTPFRPQRRTPVPLIHGSQSALVVGPSGEEVYVDKHGRVKVQFYWDRVGQRNENSSCWVRVSTPWGGKGYGGVSIPRIGNEVTVAFEEGDPDRPIILGSVYNADQTPPFSLPGAGIQQGMKSRSSPGGGGDNEISMTDTKGKELINIHAQYNMVTVVDHDDTQTVVNDRKITVTGTHTETVKKDTKISVSEGVYSHDVQKGTGTFHVKGEVKEFYDANQTTTVGKIIHIEAGDKIEIIVGKSSIVMDKAGSIKIIGENVAIEGKVDVKVDGPKVAVSGGQEVKVGVSNQQVTLNTSKVSVSGAAINSSAVGMHEIAGAVVKIN